MSVLAILSITCHILLGNRHCECFQLQTYNPRWVGEKRTIAMSYVSYSYSINGCWKRIHCQCIVRGVQIRYLHSILLDIGGFDHVSKTSRRGTTYGLHLSIVTNILLSHLVNFSTNMPATSSPSIDELDELLSVAKLEEGGQIDVWGRRLSL